MSNKKKTHEEYIKDFSKNIYSNNYTLLSEYKGRREKILVKHDCGNIFEIRADHLLNITKCPKCSMLDRSKKQALTHEEFAKRIEKSKNLELLSEYVNMRTPIKVKHLDCGKVFETSPQCIGRGSGCPYCNSMSKINKLRTLTHEEFQSRCSNFTLLDKYEGNRTLVHARCNNCGNIKYVKAQSVPFLSCNVCNAGSSVAESEIYDFIKSIYNGNIIRNTRNIIKNKEIDIYIPEFKLGIEYDSFYYHNSKVINKNYHRDKSELCANSGIKLIHVFEDEWKDKKDIVKSKIKYELNLISDKIYARKCYIKEVDSKTKNIFLDKNHIQGKDKSFLNLGLFYKDELVSILTISKHRVIYGNNEIKYELSRFASDIRYNVVGAFSKMIKYLFNNYDINEIISYVDLRYSNTTNQYKDFIYLGKSTPNYWYIFNGKRYHRYTFAKHTLKNRFPDIYSDDLTESEIMDLVGALKVYDCGNAKYLIKKDDE